MPSPSFLAKLGLFVVEGFLNPSECARIREEMRTGPATQSRVGTRGQVVGLVDERRRKSQLIEVSDEMRSLVRSRMFALKPDVERHFGVQLADDMEVAKFLVYRQDDFFIVHTDRRGKDEVGPPVSKRRRVNVIVFLNHEGETGDAEAYQGGSLTIYGLIDKPEWRTYGFPVTGKPGLLIAFPSHLWHEVVPVTRGERYAIVSRFLDPLPAGTPSPVGDGDSAPEY